MKLLQCDRCGTTSNKLDSWEELDYKMERWNLCPDCDKEFRKWFEKEEELEQ